MHTILGANGTIARELSRALAPAGVKIRQVARNPRRVNPDDELLRADLLDESRTADAVAGSEVVYLVAGLRYAAAVWEDQWPRVMRNVIVACKRHGARLVFFDNVYAYGLVDGAMTEQTPFNPVSRKGEVRARIATMLLDEMRAGGLPALIARCADFYGPAVANSFPQPMVFERIRAGKSPRWMGNPQAIHSFTFTPDAGRAVALLGQTPGAFGQTWHLPTSCELLTGAEFVHLACKLAGRPCKVDVVPGWMLKLLGLVNPIIRENDEMMYQFSHDYRFDSNRFVSHFGIQPTGYRDGIRACLDA